jgi:hypothetical protein
MADLNLTKVKGGLKITSQTSSFVLNEWSTKINDLNNDEITIISDVKDNYAELDIVFADYDNVLYNGDIMANAQALEVALQITTVEVDANLQDQTTRPIIAKFNRVTNNTTLSVAGSIDDTSITVNDATGIAVGSYIIIFNPTDLTFMFATAINIAAAPSIVIDTPLDSDYPIGTNIDIAVTDMSTAVGTLATPIVFGLRGTGAPPGVDLDVDITRMIFKLTCTSSVDLTKFGNFARLVNGLVLRRRNNVTENIFNVKDNGEIAGIMFDFQVAQATNPAQGVDGFTGRLTFAGMSKIGVAIRLPVGDDLEFLIQDDLETAQAGETITLFEIVAEGHIVEGS